MGKIRRKPNIFWASIDWMKSDAEIARETGVTIPSVRYRRRQFAPHTSIKASPRVWPDDLGKVPDAEIAARLGVSRQAVQQARHNRGIPAPPKPKPARLAAVVAALTRRALGHHVNVDDEELLWRFLERTKRRGVREGG